MKRKIKIGSRDSVLAIKQAQIVMDSIVDPDITASLVLIKTRGDIILDRSLDEIGGKGLFVKEFEQALMNGDIDIAVHSYKDMPYEETEGLPVVALSQREAPFDVLVLPEGVTALREGKPIGTSSSRRAIQCKGLFEGFQTKAVRGNVPTRLSKLDSGEYAALVLAQAGLLRLGLAHRISRVFSLAEMIPSGSQGILAVQGRQGEDFSYLAPFHSREAEIVSQGERQFLKALGSGCTSPVAVYGELRDHSLQLTGMYVDPSGEVKTGKISGDADKAGWLGERLAAQLM